MGSNIHCNIRQSPIMFLILFNIALVVIANNNCEETPIRNTSQGAVRGVTKVSRGGRHFYSFTGIPYAKSPVGNLRFANPEPADAWGPWTIYNATQEPPICIQRNYLYSITPPIEGQEDCLYLNVFVPKAKEYPKLLPVLVFIHWGGFFMGRTTSGYLGPEYFMDKDVILVTFNYRLGPFGFLSTLDDEAPGNFGLKDQVLALKWIQQNIDSFGGDKDKVTISGQSAGAASAHYHMISPSSKGLFHQVITESGSALDVWAVPFNDVRLQVTVAQGLFVGCTNSTNTAVLIKCLRNVPANDIMQTQDSFKTFYGDPVTAFGMVTENKTSKNPDPFITKSPLEYIEAGEILHLPWISGTNQNEGLVRVPSRIIPTYVRNSLNANFSYILTDLMGLALSTTNPVQLYNNVVETYLGGQEYVNVSDPNSVQGFLNIYSDRLLLYGAYQAIIKSLSQGNKNIFMYSFNYEGANTYRDYFATTKEDIDFKWGVSHCDELLYLYQSPDLFPQLEGNDIKMSKIMIELWTNFVIYGTPNSKSLGAIDWNPLQIRHSNLVENRDIELLNITGSVDSGPKFNISQGFYADRMQFWQKNIIGV